MPHSIYNSRSFLLKEGQAEVKWLAKSLEYAHWYGKYIYKGDYTIIQGTVNSPVKIDTYWSPYVDIGAYVFPGNVLPYITPIIP
ncbi:MAG: hypothetical protein QM654_01325 [Dysgonamonadaceae bacterium]